MSNHYPPAFRRRPLFRLGVWLLKLDARLNKATYHEEITLPASRSES